MNLVLIFSGVCNGLSCLCLARPSNLVTAFLSESVSPATPTAFFYSWVSDYGERHELGIPETDQSPC
jgi:hypothetical protein